MGTEDRDAILQRRARFIAAMLAGLTVAPGGCRRASEPQSASTLGSSDAETAVPASDGPPSDGPPSEGPPHEGPDTDGDGVRDAADACPDVAASGPDGCPPTPCLSIIAPTAIRIVSTIVFDAHDATVSPRADPILDEIAFAMQDEPAFERVQVIGGCALGESPSLGLERAKAVVDALTKRGVAPARLSTSSDVPCAGGDLVRARRVRFHVETPPSP